MKRVVSIFILFGFFQITFPIFVYSSSIDSLETALVNANEEDSLIILNKLAHELSSKDPDRAKKIARLAKSLANRQKNIEAQATALGNLGDAFYFSRAYELANEYYKQAITLFEKIDDTKRIAQIQNYIGISLYDFGDYNQALEYYIKAQNLFSELDDQNELAGVLGNIGVIYKAWGNYEEALNYHQKSLDILLETSNKNGIAGSYNNIGSIYKNWGKYETAIEYYQKSLELYEQVKNDAGAANTLNKIGILYFEWNDLEKAVEYYEKALSIEEANNNMAGIAHIASNLGLIFKQKGNSDVALNHFKNVYEQFNQMLNPKGMSNALINIGQIYTETGQYELSVESLQKSYALLKMLDEKKGLSVTGLELARVYGLMKEFDKAFAYHDSSLAIANNIGLKEQIRDNFRHMSHTYSLQGDHEKSLTFFKKYIAIRDSVFQIEKHQQLAEVQTRFETEKIARQNSILMKEKEAILYKEKVLIYAIISGAIIFLIIVLLFINRNRIKRIASERLKIHNDRILLQKEEIQTQAEQLEVSNRELEKLSLVARETNNSIIVTNASGDINWVNDGFKKLYGQTLEELIENKGSNISNLGHCGELEKGLATCLESKKPINITFNSTTAKGNNLWVQSTLSPILNEEGEIIRIICIDMDVTHIKEAEEEIKERKKELVKAFKKSAKQQLKLLIAFEKINIQQDEITDSIEYAQRIQFAVMPPEIYLKKHLPDHFILFKPRDIVSGDFYWAKEIVIQGTKHLVIAAADCTGHGVPGAFMSMLGVAFLNEIVSVFHHDQSAEGFDTSTILSRLREKVISSLHQTGKEDEADDGMDISLIIYSTEDSTIQYSGAHNSLCLYTNIPPELPDEAIKTIIDTESSYKLYEIKADKMPLGIFFMMELKPFSACNFNIHKGDMIFMFSDGFSDQFGGEKGKKFKYSAFKQLLAENAHKEMEVQKSILDTTIEDWRNYPDAITGEVYEQIDDMLVMGIRF